MIRRVPPLGQPESTGNRIQRNRNLPDDKPAPVSKAAKRLAKKDNAEARASAGAKYPRIAATLKACHVTLQEGKKVSK